MNFACPNYLGRAILLDVSDSETESRTINISQGKRRRHCRRIMFEDYITDIRERHFHEARVDPGAMPPVNVSNGDFIPDTRNVRESEMSCGSLQVWDLARAVGIAKAVRLRFWLLLYEIMD